MYIWWLFMCILYMYLSRVYVATCPVDTLVNNRCACIYIVVPREAMESIEEGRRKDQSIS